MGLDFGHCFQREFLEDDVVGLFFGDGCPRRGHFVPGEKGIGNATADELHP